MKNPDLNSRLFTLHFTKSYSLGDAPTGLLISEEKQRPRERTVAEESVPELDFIHWCLSIIFGGKGFLSQL